MTINYQTLKLIVQKKSSLQKLKTNYLAVEAFLIPSSTFYVWFDKKLNCNLVIGHGIVIYNEEIVIIKKDETIYVKRSFKSLQESVILKELQKRTSVFNFDVYISRLTIPSDWIFSPLQLTDYKEKLDAKITEELC